MPTGRTVNYRIILDEIKPQKSEIHCTQLTVGLDLIKLPGEIITPTEYLTTANLIFNSALSTEMQNSRATTSSTST